MNGVHQFGVRRRETHCHQRTERGVGLDAKPKGHHRYDGYCEERVSRNDSKRRNFAQVHPINGRAIRMFRGEDSPFAESVYPAQSSKDFFAAMQECLKPHINGLIYTMLDQPKSRKTAYREKNVVAVQRRPPRIFHQPSENEEPTEGAYNVKRTLKTSYFSNKFNPGGTRGCGFRGGHRPHRGGVPSLPLLGSYALSCF